MNEHIEVEDLAMFALLLLPEGEAGAVRAHLRVCAACSEELHHVREDLAAYALAVEPMALPSGARERFLGAVAGDGAGNQVGESTGIGARPPVDAAGENFASGKAQGNASVNALGNGTPATTWAATNGSDRIPPGRSGFGPAPVPSSPGPTAIPAGISVAGRARGRSGFRRALPVLGWAGWAVAAAIELVAVGLRQDRDALQTGLAAQNAQTARLEGEAARARRLVAALTGSEAVRVNLTTPKAPTLPSARATYDPRSGTLLLVASSLSPLPPARVYELWLIPADGSAPVPAGTFSPDGRGNASVLLPPLAGERAAKAFGITVEQTGGSTTPTAPILLAGAPS